MRIWKLNCQCVPSGVRTDSSDSEGLWDFISWVSTSFLRVVSERKPPPAHSQCPLFLTDFSVTVLETSSEACYTLFSPGPWRNQAMGHNPVALKLLSIPSKSVSSKGSWLLLVSYFTLPPSVNGSSSQKIVDFRQTSKVFLNSEAGAQSQVVPLSSTLNSEVCCFVAFIFSLWLKPQHKTALLLQGAGGEPLTLGSSSNPALTFINWAWGRVRWGSYAEWPYFQLPMRSIVLRMSCSLLCFLPCPLNVP